MREDLKDLLAMREEFPGAKSPAEMFARLGDQSRKGFLSRVAANPSAFQSAEHQGMIQRALAAEPEATRSALAKTLTMKPAAVQGAKASKSVWGAVKSVFGKRGHDLGSPLLNGFVDELQELSE